MNDRLLTIRRTLGFKQYEFAEKLKIKPTTLSMIEKGNSALTDKNIQTICLIFRVNEEWLRRGKGEMFVQNPYNPHHLSLDAAELLDLYHNLEEPAKKMVLHHAKQLLAFQAYLIEKNTDPRNRKNDA